MASGADLESKSHQVHPKWREKLPLQMYIRLQNSTKNYGDKNISREYYQNMIFLAVK